MLLCVRIIITYNWLYKHSICMYKRTYTRLQNQWRAINSLELKKRLNHNNTALTWMTSSTFVRWRNYKITWHFLCLLYIQGTRYEKRWCLLYIWSKLYFCDWTCSWHYVKLLFTLGKQLVTIYFIKDGRVCQFSGLQYFKSFKCYSGLWFSAG